jgi:hypothetical protein
MSRDRHELILCCACVEYKRSFLFPVWSLTCHNMQANVPVLIADYNECVCVCGGGTYSLTQHNQTRLTGMLMYVQLSQGAC